MELFGYPLSTIYLGSFIVFGCITFVYILFGDMLDAAMEFLHPALVLSFFTIGSASGYLLEVMTAINSWFILIFSALLSLLLVTLLNVFVLVPIRSAEESLAYRDEDLKGRVGTVITSVPADGFGEILIEGISGRISKTAISIDNKPIQQGEKILIIDIQKGVVSVMRYEQVEQTYFH
ncbi:NfeD family protein [Fictibacillus phosphorivorans]|uniref:NfeD family protein n=1 Tax=Fictibacillus phosphorivorans TaxID=1221500 RepID=UPI00203C7F0A|nr:NfeD family protein [Fictibacillus phosphorivorans]MCM3718219.1 NfeD family protein [Fictibacillus phosphorivorans]MCM3775914.1 NfeD family protein [Fictibacillus phosphorivorans]